ncbi:hypothetical protein TorRG33x02_284060 [Trema orientale]|uniref:Uncharacterized protein n=1 Tax=Trema orientale TaxID=63057 RepID=A0A2P5CI50_TREOI|nr:hypothetical protein TorRG33x02_284060 [Trema orientale]
MDRSTWPCRGSRRPPEARRKWRKVCGGPRWWYPNRVPNEELLLGDIANGNQARRRGEGRLLGGYRGAGPE